MPVLDRVVEQYPEEVKLVVKSFPLRNHQFAGPAAAVALKADEEGKFWQVRELLMENYNKLDNATIKELAAQAGVNIDSVDAVLADPTVAARIRAELEEGRKAGVRGTPSVFVNGRKLPNRSYEGFKQAIENELRKLGNK